MTKLYFIVGEEGSGKSDICSDIMRSYLNSGKVAINKVIGRIEHISGVGTASHPVTLSKIEQCIINDSGADAIVFTGWRITDSISDVYTAYKDIGCFIVTKRPEGFVETEAITRKFQRHVTDAEMVEIKSIQRLRVLDFQTLVGSELSYIPAAQHAFSDSMELVVESGGAHELEISVTGSL